MCRMSRLCIETWWREPSNERINFEAANHLDWERRLFGVDFQELGVRYYDIHDSFPPTSSSSCSRLSACMGHSSGP